LFVRFLEELRIPISLFEIKWPLEYWISYHGGMEGMCKIWKLDDQLLFASHSDQEGNDCKWKLWCHCIQILHSDIYSVEEKTHLFFHHKILDTITYHWKPYFLLLHLARDLIKAPLACYSGDKKSVNLQYNTLGCLDDGTKEMSTKSLMFQVLFFLYFL
jgi:hypothetical protein